MVRFRPPIRFHIEGVRTDCILPTRKARCMEAQAVLIGVKAGHMHRGIAVL